jgi:hypothetical protein
MSEVRKVWAHGKLIEVEALDVGAAPAKPARSRKRHIKFPGLWEEVLAKPRASGATFLVALVLLYEAWRLTSRGHKPVVKLTDVMMRRVHVGPKGKRAALRYLSRHGLVSVQWRSNRNPLVEVHFLG